MGRVGLQKRVLMSGYPGSGKSTLAVSLAQSLGFALPSKDAILMSSYSSFEFGPGDAAASAQAWRCKRLLADRTRDRFRTSHHRGFRPSGEGRQACFRQSATAETECLEARPNAQSTKSLGAAFVAVL